MLRVLHPSPPHIATHTSHVQAIVVTPATLCANWEKEARRWLGTERMPVSCCGVGWWISTLQYASAMRCAGLPAPSHTPLASHPHPPASAHGHTTSCTPSCSQTFLLGSQKDVDERVLQFKHGSVVRVCITRWVIGFEVVTSICVIQSRQG